MGQFSHRPRHSRAVLTPSCARFVFTLAFKSCAFKGENIPSLVYTLNRVSYLTSQVVFSEECPISFFAPNIWIFCGKKIGLKQFNTCISMARRCLFLYSRVEGYKPWCADGGQTSLSRNRAQVVRHGGHHPHALTQLASQFQSSANVIH